MWSKTYSRIVQGTTRAEIFAVWADINNWTRWQDDVVLAELTQPLAKGSTFTFQPKGGPKLTLELTEVTDGVSFTDLTRFPLAKMYDAHELMEVAGGVEIRSTCTISGPLSFVWRKIVAEN